MSAGVTVSPECVACYERHTSGFLLCPKCDALATMWALARGEQPKRVLVAGEEPSD
jgi:hypothetical protein